MSWLKTGVFYFHVQLGPPDKGRAIIGLIICWSMASINDLWDGSMDKRKVLGLGPCCGQDGYRAQVLQRPIDSYKI